MKLRPPNWIFLAFAYLFAGLGIVGAFLPLLPTTPFLLLAVWAAQRGSPRLHRWLLDHPRFGPPLLAWERNRAVSTRAKWLAALLMGASWLIMLQMTEGWWVPAITAVIFVAVSAYLFSRPTPDEAVAAPGAAPAEAQSEANNAAR